MRIRDSKGRFIKKGTARPGAVGNVIVKDRGWTKILKNLVQLRTGRAAATGVQGEAAEAGHEGSGEMTNVQLATIHEYGDKTGEHPPERSFLRSTLDENLGKYQTELNKIASGAFIGGTVDGNLLLLGEQYRGDILQKINDGVPPPLADATIARKGGEETPLIDTGQLKNSLSVQVDSLARFDREATNE